MSKGAVHDAWERENIKKIIIKVRKTDPMLKDMEEAIIAGLAENQTALVKEAIKEWLEKRL